MEVKATAAQRSDRSSAVGATGVASKSGGLNIKRMTAAPKYPSVQKLQYGDLLSAEPLSGW